MRIIRQMRIIRLLLATILLAAVSAPGFAQRLAAPDYRSDDYYLRDPSATAPSRADRYRAASSVDLTGTVSSVDRDRESIRLRTSRGLRVDLPPPPIRERARGYRSTLEPTPMPVVTIIGQLVSYDENRDRMRLSTRDGDRIVIANGTPAYVRGNRISRGNMRQGDRVRATGYWNGHEILATRVELAY
jgi:hypothetical protein